jgi:hypothetical protein
MTLSSKQSFFLINVNNLCRAYLVWEYDCIIFETQWVIRRMTNVLYEPL